MATGIGQTRVAQRPSPAGTGAGAMAFHIPAQPLDQALEAYASATGQSVLYDSRLTEGRTSRPVRGDYTLLDALDAMLEGSGLDVRYTSARALVLVRADSTTPTVRPDARELQRYRGLLQARVAEAFCADPHLSAGDRRVALRLWVDAQGAIERADLLDTTGDQAVDVAVVSALRGLVLGEPLPAGAAQPFTMLIMPRSSGQAWRCPAPAARGATGRSLS
jgi:hypothetical protein